MIKVFVANIKGSRGIQGVQGLPGTNATPSDEAVAGYISTEGESATKTALSTLSPQTRQAWLYGSYLKKISTGEATRIVVRGDSMVYGQDTVSADIVPPPADVLPNGSTHTSTRTPGPYPAVLQNRLRDVYGANVSVINQGFSGDYVKKSYDRWLANENADLTLYHFGINDSDKDYVPLPYRGSVQLYIEWMERMLLRDLAWGSAVVFLTATKGRGWSSPTVLETFRSALYALAAKYGINVIDTEPFTANYGTGIYSDSIHMNTTGYGTVATRLAACLIGEGPHKPFLVTGGTVLATRPTIDNCLHVNISMVDNPNAGTPPEGGLPVALRPPVGSDGFAYYSFYTDAPDLWVVPMVYLSTDGSGTVSWEAALDFGIGQGDNTSDYAVGLPAESTSRADATAARSLTSAGTDLNFLYSGHNESASFPGKRTATLMAIRVVTPGWHTLRVKVNRPASASATDVQIMGVQFVSSQTLFIQKQLETAGEFHRPVPASFNESADILTTSFHWPTILASAGVPPWTGAHYAAPPLRVTVRSYGQAVCEYMLIFNQSPITPGSDQAAVVVGASGGTGSGNIELVSLLRATPVGATAVNANTLSRELASVQYVAATQSLRFNWKTTTVSAAAKDMKKNFAVTISFL
ncbi:hypothetical protein ASC66_01295 [Leifsonia sp. Root4]|nr:hypothetical protein ASC66_01295 [Leifsonia sp. Root4]